MNAEDTAAPCHDIVVIGGSAGAVEALKKLVAALPSDLPAAVFVVVHFPPTSTSLLPRILRRAGRLPAEHAADGEAVRPGRLYVAPSNRHLLVKRGSVRVLEGPRENRHRPAVDPLFRTAGRAYGPRVVAVVLSGMLDDGAAGLGVVKAAGGTVVVQDPEEALFPGMPRSAIEAVAVDHVLPLSGIAALLTRLAHEPAQGDPMADADRPDPLELRSELASGQTPPGALSPYTCPDCGGSLWENRAEGLAKYRCHTGHAYSEQSLLEHQGERLEEAMWAAYRALEENASLARRLAARARERGHAASAAHFEEQARAAQERAHVVRDVLIAGQIEAAASRDRRPAEASSREASG